jgi:hypothetical protein
LVPANGIHNEKRNE